MMGPTGLKNECGTIFQQNQTKIQLNFGLLLCFKVDTFCDDSAIAAANVQYKDRKDGLPSIATILVNSHYLEGERDAFSVCQWANIIAHEIGHALGFTNTARSRGLIHHDRGAEEAHYCGGNATEEWRRFSGCRKSFPPLDVEGRHWPEDDCIGLELMTPALDSIQRDGYGKLNGRLPLSRLTLAALEDMEYQVNYNCADEDEFILPTRRCKCRTQEVDPIGCHPNRWKINQRRRRFRRFRRKFLGAGVKRLVGMRNVVKRSFKIIQKGYFLKRWWWRRNYRTFSKRLAIIGTRLKDAFTVKDMEDWQLQQFLAEMERSKRRRESTSNKYGRSQGYRKR